jgi:hypothetical protein
MSTGPWTEPGGTTPVSRPAPLPSAVPASLRAAPAAPGHAPAPPVWASDSEVRPPAAAEPEGAVRPRDLLRPSAIFLASRVGTLAVVVALAYVERRSVGTLLAEWDGKWYLLAALHGYPSTIPPGHGNSAQSTLGFFPLLPLFIRAAATVTRLPVEGAGLLVTSIAGLAAAIGAWCLLRELTGAAAADRGTALIFLSPGAFVLSMVYGEGLLIAFGAGCLLALGHRKWWLAGALAALASATDPLGIAAAAPCLVAAVLAIAQRREWKALAAPVLAPAGIVAFFAYLWAHDGTPLAWFIAQRRGWQSGHFGTGIYAAFSYLPAHGLSNPNNDVKAASVLVVVAMLMVLLSRRGSGRPPAPVIAFVLAVLLLAALSPIVALSPRVALRAFPLLGLVGASMARTPYYVLVGLFALTMASLVIVSLGTAPIPFTP